MAERGRIYRWARNRSLGDAKARSVIVIAPDAATQLLERWVVVPISSAAQPRAGDRVGEEQFCHGLDLSMLEAWVED